MKKYICDAFVQQHNYRKDIFLKKQELKLHVCLPQLCFCPPLFLDSFSEQQVNYFFKEPVILSKNWPKSESFQIGITLSSVYDS